METCLIDADEVIVGVCAIDANLTRTNPFTCGERVELILAGLNREVRSRVLIIPIPDQPNNALWAPFVKQHLPTFDVAYTNNSLQHLTLGLASVDVRPLKPFERDTLSGSAIRGLMRERDPEWRTLVPSQCVPILDALGAEERLERLERGDATIASADANG
jgi:nicotinamide-nucleotide adenylyltransferase